MGDSKITDAEWAENIAHNVLGNGQIPDCTTIILDALLLARREGLEALDRAEAEHSEHYNRVFDALVGLECFEVLKQGRGVPGEEDMKAIHAEAAKIAAVSERVLKGKG